MKATVFASTLLFAATSLALPTGSTQLTPKSDNWNAAAWSNFVKSYVVFDDATENVEKRSNWNAAAWSNFVKSYVDGAEDV